MTSRPEYIDNWYDLAITGHVDTLDTNGIVKDMYTYIKELEDTIASLEDEIWNHIDANEE